MSDDEPIDETSPETPDGGGAPKEDCLTFEEGRVLGCLLEKEATTPDQYPLTLNSLLSACNQKSSREPVSSISTPEVEAALESLRYKQLAVKVHLAGSRVPKYRHTIDKVHNFSPAQRALVCVLLLRGAQTAGELNQRTERIHAFGSVSAVEHELQGLVDLPAGAVVRVIPPGFGRRVTTYAQLLTGEPVLGAGGGSGSWGGESVEAAPGSPGSTWREELEAEVATLRDEVAELRQALTELQEQLR